MKYVIAGAVAALALFVTAGTASAQHPGVYHGGGHQGGYSGHYVAPQHHGGHPQSGYYGHTSSGFGPGVYAGPAFGGGVGVYPGPVYGRTYAPSYSYGRGHVPHHRSHH